MQLFTLQCCFFKFNIYIEQFQILEHDGSALASSINATTLALVDAGIKLKG